jgi:hypothetical protein
MASEIQNIRSVQFTPFYFKDTDSLKDSGLRLLLRIFFSGFAWIQKTYLSIYLYLHLSIYLAHTFAPCWLPPAAFRNGGRTQEQTFSGRGTERDKRR